eukprot:5697771-Pyramimonas_sp.AAC.1
MVEQGHSLCVLSGASREARFGEMSPTSRPHLANGAIRKKTAWSNGAVGPGGGNRGAASSMCRAKPHIGEPLCTGFKVSKLGAGCPPSPASFKADDLPGQVFECYNGNSWGTLEKRLRRSEALVLFAQEIGITDETQGDKTAHALLALCSRWPWATLS